MFDARPLDLPLFRGFIAAAFDHPAVTAALRDLPGLLSSPVAEVLHSGRNKIIVIRLPPAERPSPMKSGRSTASGPDPGARPISGFSGVKSATPDSPSFSRDSLEAVVKIFGARGFHKLKTLVLPSKGIRAWRGAVALGEGGFETPGPIAAFERRRFGVAAESVFIAERIRGSREIRALFRELPEPDLRRLIESLAPVLAGLHRAGLVHRDLSDGNILVSGPSADLTAASSSSGFRFFFLDTNRVRRRRFLGVFARARNLVRLGLPESFRVFLLDQYALAAGPAFPRSRFGFYYRAAKRSFEFWLGFKKAIRLRAIARKLGLQ